jgi:predicted phage terminase large subunit-like protein
VPTITRTLAERLAERKAEKAEQKKERKRRAHAAYSKRWERQKAKKKAAEKAAYEKANAAEIEQQKAATQEELAQQELARREMCRRHLLPFIQRMDPKYKAGWFHKDLCLQLEQFLEDVIAEKDPRLMLFVPPRHGKSITSSIYFPAWAIGKYPHLEFIQTAYAASLQIDFSKKIQQLIDSPEYQILFPGVSIPKGFQAVDDWKIAKNKQLTGGGLMAAGVGGPLSGRGAHIGTIDDPIKNREEADSEITRASNKSWYSSTFSTRLAPGGGILIIQTRWHDDDLSGWQLRELANALKEEAETGTFPVDADRWKVVSYPAIAIEDEKYRKKGEALHPERYSLARLLKKKRNMIARDWSALYQQNPVAEEGLFFKKEHIRYWTPGQCPPIKELNVYAAGDLAISTKEHADYSVFIVAGLDADENIWILDIRRGHWDSDQITDEMITIQKTWHPQRFGVEKDKILTAISGLLNRKIRDERCYELTCEELQIGSRDKRTRAQEFRGRQSQGQVYWPQAHPLTQTAINELLRFDAGVHDDCVDAAAWIGQMLKDAPYIPPREKPEDKSWKTKLKGYMTKPPPKNAMSA